VGKLVSKEEIVMELYLEWYKIEKIDDITYVISEPHHWEDTNIYYLIGEKRNIVIDTGIGIWPIKNILKEIDDKDISVITTHVHWDHIGNHSEFENIMVHKSEEKWIKNGIPLPIEVIRKNVIRDVNEELLPLDFNINDYELFKSNNIEIVEDGEIIELGGRDLQILHTPGHSPGHIAVYDIKKKYIFTGDLIYKGRLYCNYESTEPIGFYNSIKKIHGMKREVTKIFGGHYNPELSFSYLDDIMELMKRVHDNNGLYHGSGIHKHNEAEIIF